MAIAEESQASRLLNWLHQLPSPPSELRSQQDPRHFLTPTSFDRKRRRPLGEMDSNIQTPKKARGDVVSLDSEQTPRPSKPLEWTSPVSLPPPSFNRLDMRSTGPWQSDSDRGSESQSQSASSTSNDKKRKRTPSPRKNVGLRYAAYRIDPASMESWRSMPAELQPLAKRMMIYKSGRGIVSCDYPLDELQDDIDDEHLAGDERQALGDCPRPEWIKEIASSTSFCNARKASEPAWNCDVHSRILRQALRCSSSARSGDRLRWHNITTASIEPSSLLPIASESKSESTAFQSRKADFALCLELPGDLARHLSLGGVHTLNPTFYETIRFSPLACSIETKLTGENWEDAKTQIETWASAQVAHLRGMLQKVETFTDEAAAGASGWVHTLNTMPALPFFIVQGKSWHFLYLQVMAERAVLWEDVLVGDTTSPKGVHQVVTALLAVMDWAETIWRPWYQCAVLDPLCKVVA